MQPPSKHENEPLSFTPTYTKKAFIASLDADDRANLLIHFNKTCGSSELGEKEYNLAWLSWIIGKDLLTISEEFLITEMGVVEFDESEYKSTPEGDPEKGGSINLVREHFALDKLYDEILEKKEL